MTMPAMAERSIIMAVFEPDKPPVAVVVGVTMVHPQTE
jgi:hypothetical protein